MSKVSEMIHKLVLEDIERMEAAGRIEEIEGDKNDRQTNG